MNRRKPVQTPPSVRGEYCRNRMFCRTACSNVVLGRMETAWNLDRRHTSSMGREARTKHVTGRRSKAECGYLRISDWCGHWFRSDPDTRFGRIRTRRPESPGIKGWWFRVCDAMPAIMARCN